MEIGMVGLGRMGMNMARRLIASGCRVAVYNRSDDKVREMAGEGAIGCASLAEVVQNLARPRLIWLMLPAGGVVDEHLAILSELLEDGDVIIEGGNSFYKDDLRRQRELAGQGINYLDAGVSGGIWGRELGYCLMIGGERRIFELAEPVFAALAPPGGYLYCGPAGSGHFVKMIHNGIEYGMMQAYAEGFAILEASSYGGDLDFKKISHLWNQGSVVRSWLLELMEKAFAADPRLDGLTGHVDDSGEGRWTVQQALDSAVPAPVIALSLMQRFSSRRENAFENRVIAALRREFGGHAVKPADPAK